VVGAKNTPKYTGFHGEKHKKWQKLPRKMADFAKPCC
jgi:hypothetical protein